MFIVVGAGWADDTNFRPYILGSRAAGMGGAFTGLSDDGSGSYYNPGGLAFARRSSISLSASVYGVASGSYSNVFGQGKDFTYSDLNFLPTTTSAIRKFGEINPETGVADNTFVVSVFVPDSIHSDDRDSIGNPRNAFFLSQNSQTLWLGAGYARRLGRLGIGAMGYLLWGSETTQIDITATNADPTQFAILSARTDVSTIGGVGSLGLRLDATDQLSFGLSGYSPEIGGGSRRTFQRGALGSIGGRPPQIVVVTRDDLSASPTLPFRLQFGAAWQTKPLTLTADVMYVGAREVIDNPELESQGLSRHIVREAVFNGSLGIEYVVAGVFPLRGGIFTDFAASPSPHSSATGPNVDNSKHVNRYGLTLSAGYKTEHIQTDVGVMVAYGKGQDVIPLNLDFSNLVVTDVKELLAFFFLATSYEF